VTDRLTCLGDIATDAPILRGAATRPGNDDGRPATRPAVRSVRRSGRSGV